MNCHICGKKMVAGHAVCGDCGKPLGDWIQRTRLGYFVAHPEKLAEEIANGEPWCKLEECPWRCDFERETDGSEWVERCKVCALNWLTEKVEYGAETK